MSDQSRSLDVIYEDNHLLVVNKPALLPTMGVAEDRPSLLTIAKQYIKTNYHKPGNVYLGIVSRLDAPVTGVVLLARTSKAAARLTAQFRAGSVEKIYWAMVEGEVRQDAGELADWLYKDERHRRVHIGRPGQPNAKEARLAYRVLQRWPRRTLLEIVLETGRKHQIRVQLSQHGHPVVGDRKYGAKSGGFGPGIALHSRRLAIDHPTQNRRCKFEAPLPRSWAELGVAES